jgi:hypothetical protein
VLSAVLHELAEALQASGAYLTAAQRMSDHNASDRLATAVLIEKAVKESTRAQRLFHCLQGRLAEAKWQDQTPQTDCERAAATFEPPLASAEDVSVKRP